ncbi:MAG: alpha/beta fold hydrolase [Acidobacteriota bacterium]
MKRHLVFVLALALLTGLAACREASQSDTNTSQAAPADLEPVSLEPIELEPCQHEGIEGDLLCATATVFEDREARDGRTIDLRILVVPARGGTSAPDPIFALVGGPGGNAVEFAPFWVQQYEQSLMQTHDFVFIDQRGTGGPSVLTCDTTGSMDDLQGYFEPYFTPEQVKACRANLETKADLRLYTTSIAADDLNEIRARLGYDQINLIGSSYGTRTAQIYMRRHTESTRSTILLGTAGMDQYLPLFHARDAQAGLDGLFEDCAAEPACAAAFPDLEGDLERAYALLDTRPTVSVPHPQSGEPVDIQLGRDAWAEGLRWVTYNPMGSTLAPILVHQSGQGDFTTIARMVLSTQPEVRKLMAFGMHLSVVCAEDAPFYDQSDIDRLTRDTYLADYRVRIVVESCTDWPRGEIPDDFHRPITVDVPTLLLSGELDPVTPPLWADVADAALPNSRHIVVQDGSHGGNGFDDPSCFNGLIAQFLDSTDPASIDASCVEAYDRPPFATDSEAVAMLLGGLT